MIETKRLILRRISIEDLDIHMQIMKNPVAAQFLPKGQVYTEEEILLHVRKKIDHWKKGFGLYTIYVKAKPLQKVGYAGTEISPNPVCCDIRYGLIENAQGKGYAFEAAHAVLTEIFNHSTHDIIYGVALKRNHGSLAILKKLGMEAEEDMILYNDPGLVTLSISKKAFHRNQRSW